MKRFLLGATMLAALTAVPATMRAQDHDRDHDQNHENTAPRKYYDRAHKDSHEWNDNESSNWNKYRDDHHVTQTDFDHASKRQQQNYWKWRHEHPDNH